MKINRQEYYRQWKEQNKEKVREYARLWAKKNREEHRDEYREYKRQWYQANKLREQKRSRLWSKQNRQKIRLRTRGYLRDRRRNNPHVRLRVNLSKRISRAITKRLWGVTTGKLLGCSFDDFMIYLESRFEVGMTWENYGKVWHVDHIMPCAIFDLSKPEHQRRCFHFSNLQPLFGRENLRKGAKIITNQYNLL